MDHSINTDVAQFQEAGNRRDLLAAMGGFRQKSEDAREGRKRAQMVDVVAGLTLLQGFVAAGMPKISATASRFEEWDRLVRQAVLWLRLTLDLDVDDPIGSVNLFKSQDSERSTLFTMLSAWRNFFGDAAITSSELQDFLESGEAEREHLRRECKLSELDPSVRSLLNCFSAWSRNGKLPCIRSLGNILRGKRGRRVDGFYLDRAGEAHGGVSTWRVLEY